MAGLAYYQRQPPFKKKWQRISSGIAFVLISYAIGHYVQGLVDKRYSRYRGRTALYGDQTVRNGWLEVEAKDK